MDSLKWSSDGSPHQAEIAFLKENSIKLVWMKHLDGTLGDPDENMLEACSSNIEALTSLKDRFNTLMRLAIEIYELKAGGVIQDNVHQRISEIIFMIRNFDSEIYKTLSSPKLWLVNKSLKTISWIWIECISEVEEAMNAFLSILLLIKDSTPFKKTTELSNQNYDESFEVNDELINSDLSVHLSHDHSEMSEFNPIKLCNMKFYKQLFAGNNINFQSKFERSKELNWKLGPFSLNKKYQWRCSIS